MVGRGAAPSADRRALSALLLVRVEEIEGLLEYLRLSPSIDVRTADHRQPGGIDALRFGVVDHRLASGEHHRSVLIAMDHEHGHVFELLVRKVRIFERSRARGDGCPALWMFDRVGPNRAAA